MMLHTKHRYDAYAYRREEPEARFLGGYPEWKLIDETLGSRGRCASPGERSTRPLLPLRNPRLAVCAVAIHWVLGRSTRHRQWAGHK